MSKPLKPKGEEHAQELAELLAKHGGITIQCKTARSGGMGMKIKIRLNSRTETNLQRLHNAFAKKYGKPLPELVSGLRHIETPIALIRLAPDLSNVHLAHEAMIEIKPGFSALVRQALKQREVIE